MASFAHQTGRGSDFAATVDELLGTGTGGADSIIQVHHTTQVEASALKRLLYIMSRKLQLQELELARQADAMAQMHEELQLLRTRDEEYASLRRDVRQVAADVETLSIQQKVHAQRIDRVGALTEDMQVDVSRALYGGVNSGASALHQHHASMSRGSALHSSDPPQRDPQQHQQQYAASEQPGRQQANLQQREALTPSRLRPPPPLSNRQQPLQSAAVESPFLDAVSHFQRQDQFANEQQRSQPQHGSMLSFTPLGPPAAPVGAPAPASHHPHHRAQQQHASASPGPRPMAGIELTETANGMKVTAVKPGGPAHAAGITVGEYVLRMNGKDVRSKADFISVLDQCVSGQCIDIVYRRENMPTRSAKIFLAASNAGTTPSKVRT